MKTLAALILISPLALGQTVECVEVPYDYKIVFVPWYAPTSEIKWTWHLAKDPVSEDPAQLRWEDCSERKLVVSPYVCVKGWVPVD